MTRFMEFVNRKHGLQLTSYAQLHQWSTDRIAEFWASVWEFVEIVCSKGYDTVVDDLHKFPGARWFEGARLNYAENLLRYRDERTALVFRDESGRKSRMSYAELYATVSRLARWLRQAGIGPGDRVAAYMPNTINTVVAMLAATGVGATWASCATDLGPDSVVDRLGQIEPKVLFTVDEFSYKGKVFNALPNAAKAAQAMPSVQKVVVTTCGDNEAALKDIRKTVSWEETLSGDSGREMEFAQLPFDHPLFIMFSSGTTGKPKCMVQGAGGVLLNHLKEIIIHADLRRNDVHFFITTCSWMMWNWMLSSLATGNTVILYDGNPSYPDAGAMWRLIEEEKVSMFGTSASYINFIRSQALRPKNEFNLSALREIWQTGSPLLAEGFEYVYREIKEDLHFNSSAGGTDINGCFCTGSPILPVFAGQLQSPGLGMKIRAYDDNGRPVADQQGELVCEAPVPSMPLEFWNDPERKRYREAYFNVYPGVWRHGDYVIFHSDTGGVSFLGRSDAVLKPSGVRIGTAEIYSQVEELPEIADSLAIGQNWKNDQRIVLFVKLAPQCALTEQLRDNIRIRLRDNASPRHVPAKIIEVPDIPYTLNMKKVESAVTNIIHGKTVANRDALMNPECLEYYANIPELQT